VLLRLPNGAEYYYLPRELYSVAALTDEDGAIVEAATYDTYGQVAVYDGSAQAVEESPVGNPYYFTGRRLDLLPTASSPQPAAKQMYHYRAREYDPGNGRFMQRDPVSSRFNPTLTEWQRGGPALFRPLRSFAASLLTMRAYEYVGTNPCFYSDPSGLHEEAPPASQPAEDEPGDVIDSLPEPDFTGVPPGAKPITVAKCQVHVLLSHGPGNLYSFPGYLVVRPSQCSLFGHICCDSINANCYVTPDGKRERRPGCIESWPVDRGKIAPGDYGLWTGKLMRAKGKAKKAAEELAKDCKCDCVNIVVVFECAGFRPEEIRNTHRHRGWYAQYCPEQSVSFSDRGERIEGKSPWWRGTFELVECKSNGGNQPRHREHSVTLFSLERSMRWPAKRWSVFIISVVAGMVVYLPLNWRFLVACDYMGTLLRAGERIIRSDDELTDPVRTPELWQEIGGLVYFAIPATVAIGTCVLLGRGSGADLEPRCQRCGYCLRGLSVNYCPECGTAT